jgi:1-acyl-sn-glycerol-3-phosphate acyltransferase
MPLQPLKDPENIIHRVRGNITFLVTGSFLFGSLLFANFMQILSMLLLPISRAWFRSVNRFIANSWWGVAALVARKIYGTNITITGDQIINTENAILVCNHQEMTDIPVLFELGVRNGRLGDIKWYVKDILKYIPGVGWGMLFLDCIFIKRNWTNDKNHIRKIFSRLLKDKVPVWVISFVEGTRMKPKKLEASKEFAKARGTQSLDHLLIPRTKGFVATVNGLSSHLDAVYDVTIGYHDGVPTLRQYAKGYVKKVNVHVTCHQLANLPEDSEGLADWLSGRFQEKDRLLEKFYQEGSF